MLRVLVLALTLAVLSSAASRAGTADGYRLAGIIALGKDYPGLLVLPGGQQLPVRRGSTIDGGEARVYMSPTEP